MLLTISLTEHGAAVRAPSLSCRIAAPQFTGKDDMVDHEDVFQVRPGTRVHLITEQATPTVIWKVETGLAHR